MNTTLRRISIALLAGALALLVANCAQAQQPPKGKGGDLRNPEALRNLKQGRKVTSGRETYREVGEVRVVRSAHRKGEAKEALAARGIDAKSVVATKGNLVFYVPRIVPTPPDEAQATQRVVLNERTGELAAVLGSIEVRLAVPGSAADLARDHGLILKRDYPQLRAAFLEVTEGQDPFDMAAILRADPRVASADAEVLENPAIPH